MLNYNAIKPIHHLISLIMESTDITVSPIVCVSNAFVYTVVDINKIVLISLFETHTKYV